jgi:hypothetical protein
VGKPPLVSPSVWVLHSLAVPVMRSDVYTTGTQTIEYDLAFTWAYDQVSWYASDILERLTLGLVCSFDLSQTPALLPSGTIPPPP